MGRSRPTPWTKEEMTEAQRSSGTERGNHSRPPNTPGPAPTVALHLRDSLQVLSQCRSQRQSLLATRNRGVALMPRLCTTGPESAECQNYAARTATQRCNTQDHFCHGQGFSESSPTFFRCRVSEDLGRFPE